MQSIADYLAQLLKDRKQLAAFPNIFIHVERLIDEGKSKGVRVHVPFRNLCGGTTQAYCGVKTLGRRLCEVSITSLAANRKGITRRSKLVWAIVRLTFGDNNILRDV